MSQEAGAHNLSAFPSTSFSFPSSPSTASFNRSGTDHPFIWIEKNWNAPSPAMIPIPNPARTAPDAAGKAAQSRAVRQARVEAIRRRRTAHHVSHFLRIQIVLTPALTFPVTVEADWNIEHLARLVEAEYAFRYHPKPTETLHDETETEYEPLECGLLYDVGMVALRFTDRIGDVLNMNDVVNVLNAFEVSPRRQLDPNVIYSVGDLVTLGTDDAEVHQPSVEGAAPSEHPEETGNAVKILLRRAPPGKIYKLIPNPTSDDRCFSILHNKLGLEYFQQFCTRTYSVENLLFWLDTEMFQFAKSSSSALLQARYIYITYIDADAPLQVNLTEEMRKDVPWPLPDGWVVDPNMFDEAQEHVYFILRKQIYPMFEESEFYQQFLKAKREDRAKYEAARITGPFTDYFAPNLDVMRSCSDLAAPRWGSESNSRSDLWMKEQLLDRTMKQFFSSHGPVVDYFSDSHRLTTAQKFRKVQKEKKLASFFGEKLSSDLIARQVDTAHARQLSPAYVDDGATQGSYPEAREEEAGSKLYLNKRKVKKLEGFFGDRLGQPQLVDQNLMISRDLPPTRKSIDGSAFSMMPLRRSSSSPQLLSDSNPILVTSNELSLEERRLLSKRSRKLRGILGEPLNEDIVASAITKPAKGLNTQTLEHTTSALPRVALDLQKTGEGSTGHGESDRREKEGVEGMPRNIYRLGHERSLSVDSMQTIDSVQVDRDSREYRRKKLEKLYQFLGEKIPAATLSGRPVGSDHNLATVEPQTNSDQPLGPPSGKQLSYKEKQANIKRFNKLGRLLGEHPPSDLISNTDTVTLQTESIANLGKLLTDPDSVLELVDYISDFELSVTTCVGRNILNPDKSRAPLRSRTNLQQSSSADGSGAVLQRKPSLRRDSCDSEIACNAAKLARQRKLMKLRRFFGDQLDPVHLVEQSILEDLEKSIDDEMNSGRDVGKLKLDLRNLRTEIRKRRATLQFGGSPLDDKPSVSPPAEASPSLPRRFGSTRFGSFTRANPIRTSVTYNSGLASFHSKNSTSSSTPRQAANQPPADSLPASSEPPPPFTSSDLPLLIPPTPTVGN